MTNKHLKIIIIGLLFVLAALLGLSRRDSEILGNRHSTATFLAVGDIMLSRDVARQMMQAKNPSLPFQNLENFLRSANFNFGNLEGPITESSNLPQANDLLFNVPRSYVGGLSEYNFQALTLANNHAFDQGPAGAAFTRAYLAGKNIKTVGTGQTLAEAWQGQVVTANDIRIGFLGAAYGSGKSPGSGVLANIRNQEQLRLAVDNLKPRADYIVVAMHAGEEYVREPTQAQVNFAQAAIDAGADLVIGAHPHWIQPVEQYKGKYIFYSLGNFIFDQGWSRETTEGLTIKVELEKQSLAGTADEEAEATLKRIDLIPVIIEHYCCPRLAAEEEAKQILQKINITNQRIIP